MVTLLLALLITPAAPNPKLTPGKTNPTLTKKVICASSFRTEKYRNVPESEKKKVCIEYGHTHDCPDGHYEIDHLISLELGGSNDIENLWPQPYAPKPGAREKDVVETSLHRDVCAGKISLGEAQRSIVKDWYSLYLKYRKKHP